MVEIKKLKNGLPIILAPLHDTQAVTVLVLAKVGSRYESAKVSGISHFIEHLLFKGSKKRKTSLAITKALDNVGANYNAFTSKDMTGYYIKVGKKNLKLALDVLSDMVLAPLFEKREMEKERGVIIEEINMYEDNPLMGIEGYFEEEVFKGHPLSRKISGEKEDIKRMSREDIVSYFKKHYLQGKLLLGLSGNFNNNAIQTVEQFFGSQKLKNKEVAFKKFDLKQTSKRFKFVTKDTQQIQTMLGFPAFGQNHPLYYPTALLATILGGNMSSRLFTEVREKRGLCYFVRASFEVYEDVGTFAVQAGLDPERLLLAFKTIKAELEKIKARGISKAELNKAKEFIKGKLILNLEDSADLISWLTHQQLMFGKIETLEEKIKKIEAVTLEQVNRSAKEIINWQKFNLAFIGPEKHKKDILKIFN